VVNRSQCVGLIDKRRDLLKACVLLNDGHIWNAGYEILFCDTSNIDLDYLKVFFMPKFIFVQRNNEIVLAD